MIHTDRMTLDHQRILCQGTFVGKSVCLRQMFPNKQRIKIYDTTSLFRAESKRKNPQIKTLVGAGSQLFSSNRNFVNYPKGIIK